MAIKHVLIINGPNLNMLGIRQPEIYGTQSLSDIEGLCRRKGDELGMTVECRQSNHEGEIVNWVQEAYGNVDGMIVNAGAYTHTSIALHDALQILDVPIIEVHITDPKKRESFRHVSYIEPVATKTIAGKGANGYAEALDFLSTL